MDNKNKLAPIAVFAYKRRDKIENCLQSLIGCDNFEETPVYIFSDGYKGIEDKEAVIVVREYLNKFKSIHSNVNVIVNENNNGLSKSIIEGVTNIIDDYGKIIVLEDDLIVSRDFIDYMNDGLDYYEKNLKYGMISSYTLPLKSLENYDKDVYAVRKGECWGWATWKNRWKDVDWELTTFDNYLNNKQKRKDFSSLEYGLEEQLILQHEGKLDAWAARWFFHLFNKGYLTIYPKICRTINTGNDSSGENCNTTSKYINKLNSDEKRCAFYLAKDDISFEKKIYYFSKPSINIRIKNHIKKVLKGLPEIP